MLVANARKKFRFDPPLTDRQLWALGMIVCQWTILEKLVDQHALALLNEPDAQRYKDTRAFSERRRIWIDAIKRRLIEPHRTNYVQFAIEVANLQNQRDGYVHSLYGGMREPHREYRHAGMIRNISHVKGVGDPRPTDFATMRNLAVKISEANMTILFTEKELLENFRALDLKRAFGHISK